MAGVRLRSFGVEKKEDKDNASKWITIKGVGATPSERKKDALTKAKEFFSKNACVNK